MEDFLKNLRNYFRSLKLTQQEIAEQTHITQAQVSRLLAGRDKFGGDYIRRDASKVDEALRQVAGKLQASCRGK